VVSPYLLLPFFAFLLNIRLHMVFEHFVPFFPSCRSCLYVVWSKRWGWLVPLPFTRRAQCLAFHVPPESLRSFGPANFLSFAFLPFPPCFHIISPPPPPFRSRPPALPASVEPVSPHFCPLTTHASFPSWLLPQDSSPWWCLFSSFFLVLKNLAPPYQLSPLSAVECCFFTSLPNVFEFTPCFSCSFGSSAIFPLFSFDGYLGLGPATTLPSPHCRFFLSGPPVSFFPFLGAGLIFSPRLPSFFPSPEWVWSGLPFHEFFILFFQPPPVMIFCPDVVPFSSSVTIFSFANL